MNYAVINLQNQLGRVYGVSRVQVFDGQYALRICVDLDKLAKLGVTATDIISAIQTQNDVTPRARSVSSRFPRASSLFTRFAHKGVWSRRNSLAT